MARRTIDNGSGKFRGLYAEGRIGLPACRFIQDPPAIHLTAITFPVPS
jgi:hypothetical protein